MKIFLGTDICEIDRIQTLYTKYQDKFLNRTFTQKEIEYCLSKPGQTAARLAARFATKEAVSKALGVGLNGLGWTKGVNWKDIELIRNENGMVSLSLTHKAKEFEKQLGIDEWAVSISHSHNSAISTVIGYKES